MEQSGLKRKEVAHLIVQLCLSILPLICSTRDDMEVGVDDNGGVCLRLWRYRR